MVEEFPDQLAFKYTTMDYTRTYSEFRDDVDTFARALVSLGVKSGDHVAVWATNLPQWYIASGLLPKSEPYWSLSILRIKYTKPNIYCASRIPTR